MVHSRGRAITLCLECANKSKQYDKRLKSKERHPWQKDYQKTSRLKYNPPTDFVDIIENE